MRIHVATDHAGMDFSERLRSHLAEQGHEVIDHGPVAYDPVDDYPAFCIRAAQAVVADQQGGAEALGIVFGGSGNGEQIAANKVQGIRAALVWSEATATLAREHNDANVIALGARQHTFEEIAAFVDLFIATPFSNEERHVRRIEQIAAYESDGTLLPDPRAGAGGRLMPEGHSVHRIARQFARNFVGKEVSASSPQGRFVDGAEALTGHTVESVTAVGKQMFLGFDGDLWLRIHLGMYGAWDFAGEIELDPTIASANGRMGQTNQRGTDLDAVYDSAGENSLTSIGAPRKARTHVRMSEQTTGLPDATDEWPPPVVGQVRLRLLTDATCADLRGPTACELVSADAVTATIASLGPDPLVSDAAEGEERFVAAVGKKRTPIGLLLMDQAVVSGIGNVYRAEMLFRARQNPYTPGKDVPTDVLRELWRDWAYLLPIGVETGQMMTMDDLDPDAYRAAMASRDDRHWVYHRAGLPCRVCGTHIVVEEMANRKLYWCPRCQA